MQQRVRGILISDGMIVLIKRVKQDKTYYVFPGGGVEKNENLTQALKREMKEELGVDISIGKLLFEKRFDRPGLDQTEYFYLCDIIDGLLGTGNGPEYQIGNEYEGTHEVVRLPIKEIEGIDLLPAEAKLFVLQNYGI